jgi:ATP-binding cassette subfamily B protein
MAINKFVNGFKMEELIPAVLILLTITIVGVIFGLIMALVINKITYSIITKLRIDSFNKILKVEVRYLDKNLHGDLLQRIISDTDNVADGLLQGFEKAFTGFVTIITTIIFMLITKWQIALIVILLTPLSMVVSYFISRSSFKTFKEQAKIKGELTGFTNEMIHQQRQVIAYSMMDENIKKYNDIDNKLYKVGVKAQFASSLANPSTRFVNAIVYLCVATIGAISIINNPNLMDIGKLSIFLSYASQYTKPFNEITGVAAELSNSFASLRRCFELIDEKEILDDRNLPSLDVENCEVELSHVKFSYDESKPLIKDLSLKALKGEKIAIVGPTGCGKTTLINLLMRFYDINDGKILIDGKNVYEYNRKSLINNLSMVLQDTWLFKGSVYENVAYAKEGASKEEVIEALKKAYAYDFVSKMPQGLDTIVSDDEGLSIGQKQLLCIARLMLNPPKILILDEATSNIDTRTEILVNKAFDKLLNGRTSFVIAHRLSTIRNSDLILVMKDGDIIEQGTHKELLEKGKFYKSLYNSQFEG